MGISAFKPGPIVITRALYYQCVAFPMSHGIAHPSRVCIIRQLAAIQKNLAILEVFREQHNQGRSLYDLDESTAEQETEGKTFGTWAVIAQIFIALPMERFRPRFYVRRLELIEAATGTG